MAHTITSAQLTQMLSQIDQLAATGTGSASYQVDRLRTLLDEKFPGPNVHLLLVDDCVGKHPCIRQSRLRSVMVRPPDPWVWQGTTDWTVRASSGRTSEAL